MIDEFVYKMKLDVVLSLMDPVGDNLDIGCGDKQYTSRIPNCIGVDPNEEFEGIINKPDFCMSAEELRFDDNSFGNIFYLDTLEHVGDLEKAISEGYRVLKPRGCMVIVDPNDFNIFLGRLLVFRFRDAIRGNPDHKHHLDGEDLIRLISPFFTLEKTKKRFIFDGYKFRSNKK
jgi:SAM-dependent methyltransferase